MASQTDKKEEFRKYLEKGKVLAVLTSVLTDLFEMNNKPEDPLKYLHQRFGESITAIPPINGTQKDVTMADLPKKTFIPSADQEMVSSHPLATNPAPNNHPAPVIPAQQPPTASGLQMAPAPAPVAQVSSAIPHAAQAMPTLVASATVPTSIAPNSVPAAAATMSEQVAPPASMPVGQAAAPSQRVAAPTLVAATTLVAPKQPQQSAGSAQATTPAVNSNPASVQ